MQKPYAGGRRIEAPFTNLSIVHKRDPCDVVTAAVSSRVPSSRKKNLLVVGGWTQQGLLPVS